MYPQMVHGLLETIKRSKNHMVNNTTHGLEM